MDRIERIANKIVEAELKEVPWYMEGKIKDDTRLAFVYDIENDKIKMADNQHFTHKDVMMENGIFDEDKEDYRDALSRVVRGVWSKESNIVLLYRTYERGTYSSPSYKYIHRIAELMHTNPNNVYRLY